MSNLVKSPEQWARINARRSAGAPLRGAPTAAVAARAMQRAAQARRRSAKGRA